MPTRSFVLVIHIFLWLSRLIPPSAALILSSSLPSTSSPPSLGKVTGLYRHAVKGLSADSLTAVHFQQAKEAFPDDRRFALLYQKNVDKFQEQDPNWLHKENFLCAFTAPKLLARYQATYQLHQQTNRQQESLLSYGSPADYVEILDATCSDSGDGNTDKVHRWLSLRERATDNSLVLGPVDLATSQGRDALASFLSIQSGKTVVCVTQPQHQTHTHQFGNTSYGVKLRQGDTRTMHIINAATVRDITSRTGVHLNPTRFRPNIVIDGVEPWSEFDWIGKRIQVGMSCQLTILTRTVRCDGVSVDPLDPDQVIDIPQLLIEHYPHHGPYLGVYAALDVPGTVSLGDQIRIM